MKLKATFWFLLHEAAGETINEALDKTNFDVISKFYQTEMMQILVNVDVLIEVT